MSEKCCNQRMIVDKLTLTYTKEYSNRQVLVFECRNCGHKRMFKHYVQKNGKVFTRWHYGKTIVNEENARLETQILNTKKGFDSFLVVAGEFTKRISKGIQLRRQFN